VTETIEPMATQIDQQQLAQELVEQARVEGVELVGAGGLLTRLTKSVLETALEGSGRQGSRMQITLCTAGVEGSSPFVSTTLATDTSKVALTRRSQSAGRVWTWQPLGTRYPRIVGVVAVTAC
jgi:hypothetical protein